MATCFWPRAPRAPGERQPASAGVYSGAMMMPPPYRLASTRAAAFGAAIFEQGDLRLSSGKNLKMQNFGGVLSNFAPVLSGLTDRGVSKNSSKLSSRAGLPRVVQRSGAHRTRRKTIHHLNSALVGGSLEKKRILYRFCLILRRSLLHGQWGAPDGPQPTPLFPLPLKGRGRHSSPRHRRGSVGGGLLPASRRGSPAIGGVTSLFLPTAYCHFSSAPSACSAVSLLSSYYPSRP